MTNLTATAVLSDVPQLETTTLALGGAGGPMNAQAQALINRDAYIIGLLARRGTATLVAGTATVSLASVTANSQIFLTSQAGGGTPGFLRISARTPGTSFTILSSSGSDTSTVAYMVFEP